MIQLWHQQEKMVESPLPRSTTVSCSRHGPGILLKSGILSPCTSLPGMEGRPATSLGILRVMEYWHQLVRKLKSGMSERNQQFTQVKRILIWFNRSHGTSLDLPMLRESFAPRIFLLNVYSIRFNDSTCKDRKLRLFDPRAGSNAVVTAESHSGIKGSRVEWLGSLDRIVTTGFSKSSERQVYLWDSRDLEKGPIKTIAIDQSSGTLMPFWSGGNNMLFLAGKGCVLFWSRFHSKADNHSMPACRDGNIRYYEYQNDDLFYLTEYSSASPQRGMTFRTFYLPCLSSVASVIDDCFEHSACESPQRQR